MYDNYDIAPIISSDTSSALGAVTGVTIVLVLLIVLIALALVIITLIAECKIVSKAGDKWWKGIIPLYNGWMLNRISGLGWWWYVINIGLTIAITGFENTGAAYILSIAVFLGSFNMNYNLSKKFEKSNGFAVLLLLLPFIGYPILAFGPATYKKDITVDKNGIFSVEK